jgi:D-alanyl-D-alanine carboxypeptidase
MNSLSPKRVAQIELAGLALVTALFLTWSYGNEKTTLHPEPLVALNMSTTTRQVAQFPETPIEAQSAFVYDALIGKTLYEKASDVSRPLASLTKLMTALTASTLVPDYLLVRISTDDIRQEGDTGLFPNEEWNFNNLVDFSLITSSNDGIRAVANAGGLMISSTSTTPIVLFVQRMNTFAAEIGLGHMHFENQSGLDVDKTLSGGYGSAHDVAMLVDYILEHKPHLLEATSFARTIIPSNNQPHVAQNTDTLIGEIPNVLGSKTGFTDLSGGNVVVAFNAGLNHPIIISVLGSSYDGRFKDLDALVRSTVAYLSHK